MSLSIHGKSIAFTGALYKMSRKEATMKAIAAGASVKAQFSAQTCDFLVTGGASNDKSSKLTKASESSTQVIAEADFFQAIGMPVPEYDAATFQRSAPFQRKERSPTKVPNFSPTFGSAPAEVQYEMVVQPDGTLVQQAIPVQAAPEGHQPAAPKARKTREPRAARPVHVEGAPPAPIEMAANGTIVLTGKCVVFTGTLGNLNRLSAAVLVHKMGGTVNGSLSAKTDLLVCGARAGTKMAHAARRGIPTISEDDFVAACAHSAMSPTIPLPLGDVLPTVPVAASPIPEAVSEAAVVAQTETDVEAVPAVESEAVADSWVAVPEPTVVASVVEDNQPQTVEAVDMTEHQEQEQSPAVPQESVPQQPEA